MDLLGYITFKITVMSGGPLYLQRQENKVTGYYFLVHFSKIIAI